MMSANSFAAVDPATVISSVGATAVVLPLPLASRRLWRSADALHKDGGPCNQGSLALSYPLPAGLESDPRPTSLVVVSHGDAREAGQGIDAWAATFLQAVIEVIASDRPATQLVRWTSRRVYAEVTQRQQYVARHRTGTSVRSSRQHVATLRVSQPTPRSAEVAARVTFGPRSRAVAARLDWVNGRWLCTTLHFG